MFKRMVGTVFCLFLSVLTMSASAVSDPDDAEGSKDPALFTRMPGYHIYRYEVTQFDRYEVPIASDFKTQAEEGRHTWIVYWPNEGITQPSGLQIIRNYANAASAVGGKKIVEFEDGGAYYVTLKITKGGAETWVHVGGTGAEYEVHILEKQAMQQDVVADASSLASSIRETGRAAVYGIYFDSGKWDIKPESEAALQEIATVLNADPKLKLYVVGHTDNVGSFAANLTLSSNRADAVVKALTGRYAIAASRLQPFGAGPTAPVQSNQTEEGRAKNRRVELVAQ